MSSTQCFTLPGSSGTRVDTEPNVEVEEEAGRLEAEPEAESEAKENKDINSKAEAENPGQNVKQT